MNQKTFVIGGTLLVLATLAYTFIGREITPAVEPVSDSVDAPATAPAVATYAEPSLGLSFAYPVGADGYTLYETIPASDVDTLLRTLTLVHANERAMMENPPAYSEGPISIVVNVLSNDKKQFPRQWAEENTPYSNIQMVVGEVTEAVVGGANALAYHVDGLYSFDVVVVSHGTNMYVLSAAYHDHTSPTYRDFGSILESVRFIPEPDQK